MNYPGSEIKLFASFFCGFLLIFMTLNYKKKSNSNRNYLSAMNWPGYKYLGPGNNINNGSPVNIVDSIAKQHDLAYDNAKTKIDIRKCDLKAIDEFGKVETHGIGEYVASAVGKYGLKTKYSVESVTGVLYPQMRDPNDYRVPWGYSKKTNLPYFNRGNKLYADRIAGASEPKQRVDQYKMVSEVLNYIIVKVLKVEILSLTLTFPQIRDPTDYRVPWGYNKKNEPYFNRGKRLYADKRIDEAEQRKKQRISATVTTQQLGAENAGSIHENIATDNITIPDPETNFLEKCGDFSFE